MNTFNLPQLIHALRINQSYMSKIHLLALICHAQIVVSVMALIAFAYTSERFVLFLAAATAGLSALPMTLALHTFVRMLRADLVLPPQEP